MPPYQLRLARPQELTEKERLELERKLSEEINECTEVASYLRNKVKQFLVEQGIWSLKAVDYEVRIYYGAYLRQHLAPGSKYLYMQGFDLIKLHSLEKEAQTLAGRHHAMKYQNKPLFLLYHPNVEIARLFLKVMNKEELLWDFEIAASATLKKQVFMILHNIIQTETRSEARKGKLNALKRLYQYCIGRGVANLEYLETADTKDFLDTTEKEREQNQHIINASRKFLFLEAEDILWDAPIWYLERFRFESARVNPAGMVQRISFLEVTQKRNRELLQQYMRYCLGVTNLTIGNIRSEFNMVRRFLAKLQEQMAQDVCYATADDMKWYFHTLSLADNKPETFNKCIISILHFFDYLKVKGYIERIPFQEQYYLKKTVQKHHDRSVDYQVYVEVMQKLDAFPEELRLMFLHLWAVGLRASEVCTLKGDAYYVQGRDAWIQVYQIKMKTYKRIPIPTALYRLMKVYLKKYQITPEDYIFKNKKGGACSYGTFKYRMLKACREQNIGNGEYLFQSHDYRHTLATFYYNNGVSIQGVRDYLGHAYEEMTEQYIDFMTKRIKKANAEYLGKPENSLAVGISKRSRYGK